MPEDTLNLLPNVAAYNFDMGNPLLLVFHKAF